MLWQNFFGSKDMLERLNELYRMFGVDGMQAARRQMVERELKNYYDEAAFVLNNWDFKKPFDAATASKMWSINKSLRKIYEDEFPSSRTWIGESFDDFVNPAYGWDIALSEWK